MGALCGRDPQEGHALRRPSPALDPDHCEGEPPWHASSTYQVLPWFLYDRTVRRCGVEPGSGEGTVHGTASGVVYGCQARKQVHPDARLLLPVLDAPLLYRPIFLSILVVVHTWREMGIPPCRSKL